MTEPTPCNGASATPRPDAMLSEPCLLHRYAVDLLCVDCGWTSHFEDGSTDHFHNHRCWTTPIASPASGDYSTLEEKS